MNTYFGFNLIVDTIVNNLPVELAVGLRAMPKDELFTLHHGFGAEIRNKFKLHHANNPFTDNSDGRSRFHADNFSIRVIEKVWEELNYKPENGVYENDES